MADEVKPQAPEVAGRWPERRRWPRSPGSFTPTVGRARLLPQVSHHYPSLRPNGWYKVIGRNPESIEPQAREGHLWIEVDGRPRQVWGGHFEWSPRTE